MSDDPETARARAEANFQKKQEAADEARQEYEANRKAALERMAKLKAQRLAREASEEKGHTGKGAKAKRPKSLP